MINKITSTTFKKAIYGLAVFAYSQTSACLDKPPIQDLKKFTTVIEYIRNYYVQEVSDNKLFENAIRGMLQGLDPHSSYLDKTDFADLTANTSGKFAGLGVEIAMEEGLLKIVTPLDDSPASRSGLQAGDVIMKINEIQVTENSIKQAVDEMKGKPGTYVDLVIMRKDSPKPIHKKVERAIISVQSVKTKILSDEYGYFRISQFQNDSGSQTKKQLQNMLKTNPKLKGIVLDLRNNPGGILDAAVEISNLFLDKSTIGYDQLIVSTKGKIESSQLREKASGKDLTNGLPVVILVNGGSASASEIVAGALQDHKRAVIMGTTSFGKGSVQTIIPFGDNESALRLTTALYYTPSGRSIQATGIIPDIMVEDVVLSEKEKTKKERASIKESDLKGHLKVNHVVQSNVNKTLDDELLYKDYQLQQAINLLKGLHTYH